jgi:hypothetical protein
MATSSTVPGSMTGSGNVTADTVEPGGPGWAATVTSSAVPGSAAWLITALPAIAYTSMTRSSSGAVISAAVTWPDGTAGTYTTDVLSALFPGAVDAYHVTYGAHAVTQPQVTRNASGAVTAQPALTYA